MIERKRIVNAIVSLCNICLVAVASMVVVNVESYCQLDNFSRKRFVPSRPGEFDTVGRDKAAALAQSAATALEREVDPDEYTLGPGDRLSVSIWTTESIHMVIDVSPEGRVVVPRAGVVDVKGKTLRQAEGLIGALVRRVYRASQVDVTLSALRSFRVYVLGAIRQPAVLAANGTERVFDVIQRAGGILDTGTTRGILVMRDGLPKPLVVDLQRYLSLGDRSMNPLLQGGDRIVVPVRSARNVVQVHGEVAQQGTFSFLEGDSLSTLIKFAGGFLPSAKLDSVMFVRVSETGSQIEQMILDLSGWKDVLTANAFQGDILLRAGDRVYVRTIPKWRERHEVVVKGEVRYPGRYPIRPGVTRLKEVLDVAGGFTPLASLEDAVIIRTSELNIEDKEFKRLEKMQVSEMSKSEQQYFKTKAREVRGVMSVNFVDLFQRGDESNNPVLRDGDSIYVPERNSYINVTGSVRNPGRIVYRPSLTYDRYIELAGGYGFRADRKATLVVKTKGDAFPAESENYALEPGDNILVLDEPESKFIEVFTQALTILTQLVTVAGVVYTIVRLR
jgi:protein involved in polysaccharide export with SLBB domain